MAFPPKIFLSHLDFHHATGCYVYDNCTHFLWLLGHPGLSAASLVFNPANAMIPCTSPKLSHRFGKDASASTLPVVPYRSLQSSLSPACCPSHSGGDQPKAAAELHRVPKVVHHVLHAGPEPGISTINNIREARPVLQHCKRPVASLCFLFCCSLRYMLLALLLHMPSSISINPDAVSLPCLLSVASSI